MSDENPNRSNDQPGFLRINDLEFYIPPTALNISEHAVNFKLGALRRSESITIKSGHTIVQFTISLVIGETKYHPSGWISKEKAYLQLVQLIHQVQVCPYVSLDNDFIRGSLSMSDDRQIAGVVQSIVLQSGSSFNMPETVVVNLQVQLFNYFPYTENFMYTSNFNKQRLQDLRKTYLVEPIKFEEAQKPYTLGGLLNKFAEDPRLVPGSGMSAEMDPFDPSLATTDILEFPGTPFEYHMYGGQNGEDFKDKIVLALDNNITLEYYDWKAPISEPPPDPGLSNKQYSGTGGGGIDQFLTPITHPGLAFNGGTNNKIHVDMYDRLSKAAQLWYTKHPDKPIVIQSMTRTLREQMALLKRKGAGQASNPTKGKGAHLNGCGFDIGVQYFLKNPKGYMTSYKEGASVGSLQTALGKGYSLSAGALQIEGAGTNTPNGNGLSEAEWNEWVAICNQSQINILGKVYGAGECWHFEAAGWKSWGPERGIDTKGINDTEVATAGINSIGAVKEQDWTVSGEQLTKLIEEAQQYGLTEVLNLISQALNSSIPGENFPEFNSSSADHSLDTSILKGTMALRGQAAEKIWQAYQKSYSAYIDRERSALKDEGWEEVETPHGILFKLKKTFEITDEGVGEGALIPIAVSVSINHNLVQIPILGWNYPTHQYLGPTPTAGSITFEAVGPAGESKRQELLGIFHGQQAAATAYRTLTSKNPLKITNCLCRMAGMDQVILDDVISNTIDGKPEATQVTVTFSEATYDETDVLKLQYFKNDLHIQRQIFNYLVQVGKVRGILGTEKRAVSDVNYKVLAPEFVTTIRFWYTPTADDQINKILTSFCQLLNRQNATVKWMESDRWGIWDQIHVWPPSASGIQDGGYDTREDRGSLRTWVDRFPATYFWEELDSNQGWAEGKRVDAYRLNPIGNIPFSAQIDIFYRNVVLPIILEFQDNEQLSVILQQYNKLGNLIGMPAYPDLNLPRNPISNSAYDTYPDFFFWNASDARIMNEKEEHWGRWMQRADDWMMESNKRLKEQIFNEDTSEWGEWSKASFFFKDTNPQKADPRIWEGMQSDKPNPPVVFAKDKNGNPLPIDIGDVVKSAEATLKGNSNAGFVHGKAFSTSNKDPEKIQDRQKRFEDFANKYFQSGGHAADVLFDKNQKAKTLPSNDGEIIHEFSARHYQEILQQTFRKEFYDSRYTMRRAFPTFKLYLIDENIPNSELGTLYTDDFYSIDAIQSITVVRHRDNPADMAIIEIVNSDGRFTHKMYEHNFAERPGNPILPSLEQTGSGQEMDVRNLAIKDGTRVQVRLGYANNPNDLETVFNGQIVSMEGTTVITMICQSYGTELIQRPVSPYEKSWWWNADTDEILSNYICSPECKHFGRYDTIFQGALTYQKVRPDGKTDRIWQLSVKTQDDNIFCQPIEKYYNTKWSMITELPSRWSTYVGIALLGTVILTPVGVALIARNTFKGFLNWQPQLNQTIWDIFKEMELRHPGWVAMPVPYGDRMTMFFGVPAHNYFYRDGNTLKEMRFESLMTSWRKILAASGMGPALIGTSPGSDLSVAQLKVTYRQATESSAYEAALGLGLTISKDGIQTMNSIWAATEGMVTEANTKNITEALIDHRIRPFRNYHIVTSETDIIANNIRADHKGVHNAIRVMYNTGSADENRDGRGELDLAKTGQKSILIRLDDDIEPEYIKEKIVVEPNAQGPDMAVRYGIGHLLREARRYYRGELIILGNAKIKPTDVIYITDSYNDIVGPIEVERVTHMFRQETGFITEIVPNMCAITNEDATLTLLDGAKMLLGQLWSESSGTVMATAGIGGAVAVTGGVAAGSVVAGSGAVGTLAAGSMLTAGAAGVAGGAVAAYIGPVVAVGVIGLSAIAAMSGGLALIRMMQTRNPIILYPLLRQGKPYASGLQGYEIDGLITHLGAKWNRWLADLKETSQFYSRGFNAVIQSWWRLDNTRYAAFDRTQMD